MIDEYMAHVGGRASAHECMASYLGTYLPTRYICMYVYMYVYMYIDDACMPDEQ